MARENAATPLILWVCAAVCAHYVLGQGGNEVALTAREYEVLEYFLAREDRVVSREDLLENVWGFQNLESNRTVDNFVTRLRSKLDEPKAPVHFLTVRGVGYRFVGDAAS